MSLDPAGRSACATPAGKHAARFITQRSFAANSCTGRVGQAILPAAGFSAGPVKLRIRLEKPAEKPAAARIGCPTNALQHWRIVPQQRPAHDFDRRVALSHKRIVKFLQRRFPVFRGFVILT
jgi:hypothetical protein